MIVEQMLKNAQTPLLHIADVMRGFLLPFKGIMDLERAYKKILALHQMEHEQTVAKLKANGIPYQILEKCGVAIDMATVPEGIKLKELISHGRTTK